METITSNSTGLTIEERLADVRAKWPRVHRRPGRTTKQMVKEIAAEMFTRQIRQIDPTLGTRSFRNLARSFVCPTERDYRSIAELQQRAAELLAVR
jgi:hypothetical protein